jgi:hypothetical protein
VPQSTRIRAAAIFVLAATASGCGPSGDKPITNIVEAEHLARMLIPRTAGNFACATDVNHRGQNYSVYGTFELTQDELATFTRSWPPAEIESPPKNMMHFDGAKRATWWRPQDVSSARHVHWFKDAFSVNILMGSGLTPGKTLVYFFNFSI